MNQENNLSLWSNSTDELSTENVLKSLQTFASVSGRVGLTTPRDAFITALCKASLPPHYTLTILNAIPAGTVATRGILLPFMCFCIAFQLASKFNANIYSG